MKNEMLDFLKELSPGHKPDGFKPDSQYFPGMDMLVYLAEDVSYRAARVDGYLTLLMHPTENRLVGLKLKGFRYLFNEMQSRLQLTEHDFIMLVEVLQVVLVKIGHELMRDAERQQQYQDARRFAVTEKLRVRVSDMLKAA